MATKILVPLKKHDRLEEIVPYIEELAEPGVSVVFLVRHPVSGFKWPAGVRCDITMWDRDLAGDQKNG